MNYIESEPLDMRGLTGPQREARLLAETERLLAARATPARRSGTVNQYHPEVAAPPTPGEVREGELVRGLLARLAARDETGAGSGMPG